jgi:hypothetical protein
MNQAVAVNEECDHEEVEYEQMHNGEWQTTCQHCGDMWTCSWTGDEVIPPSYR